MSDSSNIIIAGAGGIAEALGLILAEWSPRTIQIWIGNRTLDKAKRVAAWIQQGCTRPAQVQAFHLPEAEPYPEELKEIFSSGDVLLDCLPGKEAPRMARLALEYGMHYGNLTEHVRETEEIMALAADAQKAFVLQSGLAPGYIDMLAHGMFQGFCARHGVDKVDQVAMRVGALTEHAAAPSYYGFTWSPAGVATEYVEPAVVVRDFKKTTVPSLSERRLLRIHNIVYEEDLTSGGAADLPDALAGKVKTLDYKTLRYPGHYAWVDKQLQEIPAGKDKIKALQERMEAQIPHLEEDVVTVYAAVQGKDQQGTLRREERAHLIRPQKVGRHLLRAIQTTTAVPLAEVALQVLEGGYRGVVLQSMFKPEQFLNGAFINRVYNGGITG